MAAAPWLQPWGARQEQRPVHADMLTFQEKMLIPIFM